LVVRIAQRVKPLGLLRRDPYQRLEAWITAHHPIQGDEIGHREVVTQGHQIAVPKGHPGLVPAACGLLLRCLHIRAGSLEVHGALHTAVKQLVVEHTDARSHVEEAVGSQTQLAQALQD
jgi:hypothetical protein